MPEQLVLPGTDHILPTEGKDSFKSDHRWFSFSDEAVLPEAYRDLRWDRDVCPPDMKFSGGAAFGYEGD